MVIQATARPDPRVGGKQYSGGSGPYGASATGSDMIAADIEAPGKAAGTIERLGPIEEGGGP